MAGPEGGVDCIGLPIMVAWLTGIKPRSFDINGYPMQPDGSLLPLASTTQQCVACHAQFQLRATAVGGAR